MCQDLIPHLISHVVSLKENLGLSWIKGRIKCETKSLMRKFRGADKLSPPR